MEFNRYVKWIFGGGIIILIDGIKKKKSKTLKSEDKRTKPLQIFYWKDVDPVNSKDLPVHVVLRHEHTSSEDMNTHQVHFFNVSISIQTSLIIIMKMVSSVPIYCMRWEHIVIIRCRLNLTHQAPIELDSFKTNESLCVVHVLSLSGADLI